jgi:hypothetical protein
MPTAHLILCCAVLAATSCARQDPVPRPAEPSGGPPAGATPVLESAVAIPSPAAAGARYPHLAQADDGTLLLSWLQPTGAPGSFSLQFAHWEAAASGWSMPRKVAQGSDWFVNWADFPSVVPLGGGHLVAHGLQQRPGNVYAYDVRLAASEDGGRSWSAPYSPHDDGTPTEHGFVSLAATPDGQPYAVWLDGRNTVPAASDEPHAAHGAEASGAMTLRGASVTQDGATAAAEIDARTCDCCQTGLARSGNALLVVYRDRDVDETRDIKVARLVDGRWSAPVAVHDDGWRIAACPVNGPAIAARDPLVAVAWFTAAGGTPRVRIAYSTDGGRSFAAPADVASGAVAGRVDVVLLDSGHAVVSWLAEPDAIRARVCSAAGCERDVLTVAASDVARGSGFPRMAAVGRGLLFAWTAHAAVPELRTAYVPLD